MTIAERLASTPFKTDFLSKICRYHPDMVGFLSNMKGDKCEYIFKDNSSIIINGSVRHASNHALKGNEVDCIVIDDLIEGLS